MPVQNSVSAQLTLSWNSAPKNMWCCKLHVIRRSSIAVEACITRHANWGTRLPTSRQTLKSVRVTQRSWSFLSAGSAGREHLRWHHSRGCGRKCGRCRCSSRWGWSYGWSTPAAPKGRTCRRQARGYFSRLLYFCTLLLIHNKGSFRLFCRIPRAVYPAASTFPGFV